MTYANHITNITNYMQKVIKGVDVMKLDFVQK